MAQEVRTEPLASAARIAPPGKMTYEEFLAWADEDTWAEWVNGEVIILTPASNRHQLLVGFLVNLFQHFVEAHRLGVVLTAPFQMKIGPDLPGREPDILFIAREHLDWLKNTYLDGPADLVVEVTSRDSRARDRGEKFYEYEQGVYGSIGCSTTCAGRLNFINSVRMASIARCLWMRMASTVAPFCKGYGSRWSGSGKSPCHC
ncbi:MAG TPA: Uma2 family endonuclease [Candidatus Tectomicrobia bacterium]|nr:Uma2 family endonuclease [Candidatus Tectomicrobia bacterium]